MSCRLIMCFLILLVLCSCERKEAAALKEAATPAASVVSDLTTVLSGCDVSVQTDKLISLNAPCVRVVDAPLTLAGGSSITTNGYPLKLMAKRGLTIDGTAQIRSFSPPPVGSKGSDSAGQGAPGSRGVNGRPAGAVEIEILGDAKGTLQILNAGENGGPGGPGGGGSPGVPGQKGRKGSDALLYCKAGGGDGAQGGVGGPGGSGGRGGNAGAGGDVTVRINGSATGFVLHYNVSPGLPGEGGEGGPGGSGGAGGQGGSGSTFCGGGRAGPPGLIGLQGTRGETGTRATPGNLSVNPETLVRVPVDVR